MRGGSTALGEEKKAWQPRTESQQALTVCTVENRDASQHAMQAVQATNIIQQHGAIKDDGQQPAASRMEEDG